MTANPNTQAAVQIEQAIDKLVQPGGDNDFHYWESRLAIQLSAVDAGHSLTLLNLAAQAPAGARPENLLSELQGRMEALYELTGGNPRALGLIFELLRLGPNSRAVEDFERLMDITTPYYKARFEDLSEQAQVVMHALAVCRPDDAGGLRFGLTAAEIGLQAGLPTGTVSAQLDTLGARGSGGKVRRPRPDSIPHCRTTVPALAANARQPPYPPKRNRTYRVSGSHVQLRKTPSGSSEAQRRQPPGRGTIYLCHGG